MLNPNNDNLDREARVFCRYLIGQSADEYVMSRYSRAHEGSAMCADTQCGEFDRILLRFAASRPLFTRFADVWASLFPTPILRKKLVLLLAILENSPAHFECFLKPPQSSRTVFVLTAAGVLLRFSVSLIIVTLLLWPVRMVYRLIGRRRMILL